MVGRAAHLREAADRRQGAADLHPARRPAVRERHDPHRPRAQQDPEGHHRQVALARRLRRAVRAGLGLPRPAHRARGREGARARGQEPRCARLPPGVPRVRARAGRRPAQGFHPPRRDGRLGEPVSHARAALRGRAAARLRADHPQRPPLQGLQARALVPRLPLGARRGRGRVRRAHLAVDRRALRGRRARRPRAALRPRRPARGAGERGHLDHHAVDAARQPGRGGAPGVRLFAARRAGRGRRGTAGARLRAGGLRAAAGAGRGR